jgi:hypothetical protein
MEKNLKRLCMFLSRKDMNTSDLERKSILSSLRATYEHIWCK